MEVNGTITARPDCYEIRIVRLLPHAPGKLWEALTKPEKLVQWLAPGKIELCWGGAAKLAFADSGIVIDSRVTDIKAPHMIAYSWSSAGEPDRPLRFESRIVPGATELTLTVKIPLNEDAARTAAGFEAHLEMLAAALEDVPIKFPFQQFKAIRESYKETLAA